MPTAVPLQLSGSMLWGLGATLALENPELRCVLVDLDPETRPGESRELAAVLSFDVDEDRIGFRAGQSFVARLAPLASARAGASPYRLAMPTRGTLDELRLEPLARKPPGPHEVEIE